MSNRLEYLCYVGIEQESESFPSTSFRSSFLLFLFYLRTLFCRLKSLTTLARPFPVFFQGIKHVFFFFSPSRYLPPSSSVLLYFSFIDLFPCRNFTHFTVYDYWEGLIIWSEQVSPRSVTPILGTKTKKDTVSCIFIRAQVSHFSCRLQHPFYSCQSLTPVDFIIWVSKRESHVY